MFPSYRNILLVYIILFFSTKYVTASNDWQHKLAITRNLSEAVAEVIDGLFVVKYERRSFNFHVKVRNENKQYMPEFQKIIDETMLSLDGSIAIHLRNGIPIPADNERHFCVLLVDSAESLQYLYSDLHKFKLSVGGPFLIILQTYPQVHHYYDELYEIFQLSWEHGINHVDVLIYAVTNVILMFHSRPFTPFHCKSVAPIIHNKFINGQWLHKKFSTPKTGNLYGCPLVCATWEEMPYIHLEHTQTKNEYKLNGLEGKLLEYLADTMNFTVEIRWLDDMEINQTVYDEKKIFNKLFATNTDFAFGAFHRKPAALKDPYTSTTTYYLADFYFIISAEADPYDPFKMLSLPFELEVWIVLIFIFVNVNVYFFVFKLLNRKVWSIVLGRDNHTPSYNMLVVSLGGAVAKDPRVPFSRFLLMSWVLATFVLRTVYQGFMFHYIKSDLRKPLPSSISNLMSDEYRIFMRDNIHAAVRDLPVLFEKAEVFTISELEAFEILAHPQNYRPHKVAILTAMEYFRYYKRTKPISNDLFVVPERLFTQQLSIHMEKNSVFLDEFNTVINKYLSEGLIDHWQGLLLFTDESRRPKDNFSPKRMKNFHLFAAYRLLLMGLLASLLTFLCEFFISKLRLGKSAKK